MLQIIYGIYKNSYSVILNIHNKTKLKKHNRMMTIKKNVSANNVAGTLS